MKTQFTQEQISETAVRLGIPDHPFVARRIARAYDLVATNKISEISHDGGLYRVRSQYEDKIYTVELNHGNPHCTCPDNERTIFCKHSIASMMVALEAKLPESTASRRPNKLVVYDDTFDKRNGKRHSKYGRWIVNDYKVRKGYVVYRDEHDKLHCACGKKNCRHRKAVHKIADNGKRIKNECGTETAKALQEKLNGSNGTGGESHPPTYQLDTSNPFQESEQLDIDQIEGRSNGDLVHVLSNGEYVISYRGIMKLAEQHSITFEAARHDETHTVIAHARCGSNSRASGKPANGSSTTAAELAKRNAARQLLPLPEIKALERKCQLESEFNWQVAKRKCLEIVPDFTLDILIHDLVQADTLRQAHSSDYSRKEWLVIFDACKRDAETNGHDGDGGGDNTPSSDEQVSCAICSRTLTNPESVRLQVGPICRERIGIEGEAHLRGNIISDELIKSAGLYSDEAFQKRILRACLTLDAPAPVKVLNWLGNEYFGYRNRPILYYFCADRQLNRIDTHRRKLRHVIVTSATSETELDAHALAQMVVDSEPDAEVPITESEFVERCKELEAAMVEDTADDNSVDDRLTCGDGKRMLRMDKKKNILLIEPDGSETPITMRDAAFTYGSNFILRLTTGIACGGDISTVELDN